MRHDSITQVGPSHEGGEYAYGAVPPMHPGRPEGLFSELASRYLANRELIGLKRTTLMDYESYARPSPPRFR